MIQALAFVFGAIVGSFANVCIYRLPREHSLNKPPSRCSFCGQPILWYDNIPLISFFALGGKCRYCQSFFSPRYVLVEALMALLAVVCYQSVVVAAPDYPPGIWAIDRVVIFWMQHPQIVGAYFIGCAFLAALVVATFIDFDFQIIPDSITLGGLALAIVLSFINPHFHDHRDPLLDGLLWDRGQYAVLTAIGTWETHLRALIASLLGAGIGAATIWIVGIFGKAVFRKDAMGFGDVKYCAMIGALLGWQVAVGTLILASIIGAVAGIVVLIRTRQSRMPFGPYLSLAAALLFLFREQMLQLPAWWMAFVQRTAFRLDSTRSLKVLAGVLFLLFLACSIGVTLILLRNRFSGRVSDAETHEETTPGEEAEAQGPRERREETASAREGDRPPGD